MNRQGLKASLPMPYNYLNRKILYALFSAGICSTVPMPAEMELLFSRAIFNSDLTY